MNAFVCGYRVDVDFGPQPSEQSRYPNRGLAEDACCELNRLGVRTEQHFCSFTVERLPEGDFGIICVCHPLSYLAPARAFPIDPNTRVQNGLTLE